METQPVHHSSQKNPFNPIIGFAQVKFQGCKTVQARYLLLHKMGELVGNENIVSCQSTRNKCTLIRDIISGSVNFNLFDITFDAILYITLQRLIGLKSFNFFGLGTLGIRITTVSFQPERTLMSPRGG
jgi:hypothetical protein